MKKQYFLILASISLLGIFLVGNLNAKEKGQPFVYSTKGPEGEAPVSYKKVRLNGSQKKIARKKKLKIAVLMHTSSDFVNSVIKGVKDVAKDLRGEVVLVTDAEFDANKQTTDIENALVLNPDIIVILVLDPVAAAAALKPAVKKGVKIALLSNLPKGFVHGKDYTSVVTDDLFAMGKSIAELMNDELKGKGNVGLIYHDASYYVTQQRDRAVKTTLVKKYPGINIAVEKGIANPSDAEVIASAMLTQYPNINAIYAPWEGIAEGVLSAARSANRKDLKVFTMDLGATTALDLAKGNGNMAGVVADLPYELGKTLTYTGVLSVLGKKTPAFVTVPAIKVTRKNLKKSWKKALKRELPASIEKALKR